MVLFPGSRMNLYSRKKIYLTPHEHVIFVKVNSNLILSLQFGLQTALKRSRKYTGGSGFVLLLCQNITIPPRTSLVGEVHGFQALSDPKFSIICILRNVIRSG